MAYKDDKHSIFGDNFDEKLVKALGEFATVQQEQQTDATFTDTVNKLQQIGKVADQTTKKVDELGDRIDKLDGKEANVNINTTTETEDNSQLKGIRNSIDKKYVEQKRIDLNQLASKWKSEQSKEQDTDKKIDLLVKAQTAEKLKSSSTDQIKTSDIKTIIESAAAGNQQLVDQANRMYGSSENYSQFRGKVFKAISDGLQNINTKVDESFVEMSDVLNTAISQYKKNNDLTNATNVMKIVNQILAKNSKYDFTADQKKTFEDIGKNTAYSRYIYGQDSEGNTGRMSDAYKILLDKTKSSDERMNQLIEVAKTMSGISSAFDRYNLANIKGDTNVNQALAKTFRDLTNGRTSVTTVTALKDVIIEPSNSAKLNQNQTAIKNLVDIFKGSGARTPNPEYGEIVKSLIEYVNNNTTDNTFDYDTTKTKGKSGAGGGNDNSESAEIDQKELKQQKKLLQDAKKKIENEKIKQLSATQTADEYVDQYKNLISSIVTYRSDVEKFRAKFGQEADPISGYPDEYDETTLKESVGNIFAQISDYNNKVTMSKSAASNPEKQQQQANDIYDAYKKLTDVISSFENTFGVKFKQDAQIQTSVGKYTSIKNGFTSEINDKTLSFVTENKDISDKRVEMDKLMQDVIDFQDKLAPLVAKLKPAIDTEGAEVNKSDLDAFTELVDKIKTAGEAISGMNMREAMKSKLGTKAQSKLNGVQTWEEYIKTLNTRTIVDDTGEKDEKKSGEGKGDGNGNGSGASVEEIRKALEPVEGKITDVKTAVEQLDTDLGNKLDTINNTIENSKPDVNLDVDSIYDKFKDDMSSIRSGVEKITVNFDDPDEIKKTDKTQISEDDESLENKNKLETKQPTTEKKSVNTMLSELITQVGELAKNMNQEDKTDIVEEIKKAINPEGGTKLNPETITELVERLAQAIPTTVDATIEQGQYNEIIGKIEAVQTALGNELKVAISDTQINSLKQSDGNNEKLNEIENILNRVMGSVGIGAKTNDLSKLIYQWAEATKFLKSVGADEVEHGAVGNSKTGFASNPVINGDLRSIMKDRDSSYRFANQKSEEFENWTQALSGTSVDANVIHGLADLFKNIADISLHSHPEKYVAPSGMNGDLFSAQIEYDPNRKGEIGSKQYIVGSEEIMMIDFKSIRDSFNGVLDDYYKFVKRYDALSDELWDEFRTDVVNSKNEHPRSTTLLDSYLSTWMKYSKTDKFSDESVDSSRLLNDYIEILSESIKQHITYQPDQEKVIAKANELFDKVKNGELEASKLLTQLLTEVTGDLSITDKKDLNKVKNDEFAAGRLSRRMFDNMGQIQLMQAAREFGIADYIKTQPISEYLNENPIQTDDSLIGHVKAIESSQETISKQVQDINNKITDGIKSDDDAVISSIDGMKSVSENIRDTLNNIEKAVISTKTTMNPLATDDESVLNRKKQLYKITSKNHLSQWDFIQPKPKDSIKWKKEPGETTQKDYGLSEYGKIIKESKDYIIFSAYPDDPNGDNGLTIIDKQLAQLAKQFNSEWLNTLSASAYGTGLQPTQELAEYYKSMRQVLDDIQIGEQSKWTNLSDDEISELQNALSQNINPDENGTYHTSLKELLKLSNTVPAAKKMVDSLESLYKDLGVHKFSNSEKIYRFSPSGDEFFAQLKTLQDSSEARELFDTRTTETTPINQMIEGSNSIQNQMLEQLTEINNKLENGINLSQGDVSTETGDVLAQIQEIRKTLQSTQVATEAAGFKDIADTINNQVIPQIQQKNDNIIAEKKLVDKSVTAEVNRFTELANTIKNKVGEAIAAKNTLLENDLNNTKAIVDQQMEYVRQLVDSIRDMFAMSDNPGDLTKANALILEFKATENLTDDYRKEVADTLVELDKLWNTGKIEEYQNKFIELMHILESHQKQQKKNVDKDELAHLKEEAQQIKDVLGYTRGNKGKKTPTLISKEMIDSLGSSVYLLNQIYGAKGKGWRQAQDNEKGITWQDLRFMDAEDKRYTGATIVNDQDMEDAEFFMTYATKLLDTLEKIKNLSTETEIGGMLGNEQYYAQATNELENRLNSVVGKNYNAFPNPIEDDTLEGFEEVITDAEAQQKAADELEQRLTANGAQTTIVQMIDLLSTKMSELKKYIDGIANETTSTMFANLASDIGAIYQAITLIPEGGMPDLLGSNKDNAPILANLQSSIQSIYASIANNQQLTMDTPLSNLNVTLSPEGANQLTTQIANAIAAGEYTIKKFKVADDTRVASKIQAVINKEEPIVVSQFEIMPQKSLNFSNKLSQLIAESGNISLKKFDVVPENIDKVRQDIETKLNEKPIKLNNWEAGNFKRINNLVAEGVAKSISDDIQKGLDANKLTLKNWEIKGIQSKINEALKQSPVTVEDFKVGNLANAKQDVAKKIGTTKITFDDNNPIDIAALNVKSITIADEVAQKIKPIPVTVNPTNLDELVTQITDAFEVGTSKVIKLPNQAAYNTQKTNIAELVGEFEPVVKSAQDYAEAIYSITDAIKSVFEQSKPTLNEINASVNNMLNGLNLLNGTNNQESKSNTELYYEDLIKNAKNAQMRMQAGNTSVRGEAYISAMNDEYTKLISLLEQAKDGEGEFDSKLASDIKDQRTVISEMENSFKELEKTANEAEKKLAAAEARIAQAAADNLESPYTEEENRLLQDLRDMIARARSNVSQGTSGEINSALREALEMVYENVNTDGLDQSMLDRLREPVVVDYSDPEKYVKEYAESGLKVKEQLEDANSNLVKALTETQREDLSKKYYDFAELLQKIVDGNVELNADTDKEVSAAFKEIMDAFNKSIGKSGTQQSQKQKVIDVNLLNKYKKELEKYNNQLAKYQDASATKYTNKISEYTPKIDRIIEGSKNITDDTSPEAIALKESYDKLIQNIKTLKDGAEGGSGGLTKYLDTKKSAVEIDRLNKKFDELIAKIQVYAKNNSKLTTDPEVRAQFQALLSDAQSATRSAAEYDRLNASLSQLKATVSNKGLTGRSLGDDIKYIAERIGIKAALSNSIYKVIGYFRQMVTTVTELDTGMTALKRVTQETERVYTDFLKSTTQNAQALGATMSEVVNATTSFSKLGYNMQEAQTLANNAIIYKTVGDIDINTATNDMISTMKAFNMEASQSEHIVDAFDIINNKYAVSAQQVGEGLKGSAAALATANNTFEESAAM